MRRKKRRRMVRRKRRAKSLLRNILLFVLLVVLPAVAFYYYYSYQSEQISTGIDDFMKKIESGNIEEAASLIVADDGESLEKFTRIFSDDIFSYERVEYASLKGISKANAGILLLSEGESFPITFQLERRKSKWLISSIPVIQIFTGAYVVEETADSLKVLSEDGEISYNLKSGLDLQKGDVIFLIVSDDDVLMAENTESSTVSRLLVIDDEKIEGEREGFFRIASPEIPVFIKEKDLKNIVVGRISDLPVGYEDAVICLHGEKVVAAVIDDDFEPSTIRIAINDPSMDNLLHSQVRLSGNLQIKMVNADNGEEIIFPGGRMVTLEHTEEGIALSRTGEEMLTFRRRITFTPESDDGRIVLTGILREGWGWQAPSYRGSIDIFHDEDGLFLINELPLEDYLYAVVSSEMPTSFGNEVLKIQAIISRSYAYNNVFGGRFSYYGAHLDDSALSQVYNKNAENEESRKAVDDTRGLVPFYDNEPIEAIYFSTSAGYTANSEEVWTDINTGKFPGKKVPYLRSVSQVPGEEYFLADDESVKEFLDASPPDAYDFNSPYFRWQVRMSGRDIEESISANLISGFEMRPELVLTNTDEGFLSREPGEVPLGDLIDVYVVERGAGGIIKEIGIDGTVAKYRIISEYMIRHILRPVRYSPGVTPPPVQLKDGNSLSETSLLPSAFIYFDILRDDEDKINQFNIIGGGFGHGVGLSQYGARRMVEKGYNFMDILEHFYADIRLKSIY